LPFLLCLPIPPFAVPDIFLAVKRLRQLSTAAHAAPSLYPPPAALGLAATAAYIHFYDESATYRFYCVYLFLRLRYPISSLPSSGCVSYRPRHTLRPRFIRHRRRSGSRPQRRIFISMMSLRLTVFTVSTYSSVCGTRYLPCRQAAASAIDRGTRCALALSATGGARARGHSGVYSFL